MKKSWSAILDFISIIRMMFLRYFKLALPEAQTQYLKTKQPKASVHHPATHSCGEFSDLHKYPLWPS